MWLGGLGATAGPLLDATHTHSGATRYPHPQLFLAEWWVVPLFCAAALAIGLGRLGAERVLPTRVPTTTQVAGAMALFVAGYSLSGFLPWSEAQVAAFLAALF